jgi:tRNA(fMet)-specific endonuclease VapC
MIILDTDLLSLLEWRDNSAAIKLRERLAEHLPEELGTTVISFEEQMRGWMKVLAEAKKATAQIEAYRRLGKQLRLYCSVQLLGFDERAATEFQRLRKQYPRLGAMDLKIAAIVLANEATLVSRNVRDFGQIAGLRVEDWTK